MKKFISLGFFIICLGSSIKICASSTTYIGSDTCAGCHQTEHQQWLSSDHHKAMQKPNDTTVLGDFNNVSVEFHQIQSRFFQDKGDYFVETLNKNAEKQTFKVVYTFGFNPLQQYILQTEQGHLQAFNIAWDSRAKAQGGQRWYHLQPDETITPDHPFFWQRHFQNWNSRCAECHTTGFQKQYEVDTHSYNSQFSELNVGCESCHGAGQQHQQQAQAGKFDPQWGFAEKLTSAPLFTFAANAPIANLASPSNEQYLQQCASCHSRRLPLQQQNESNSPDYHQAFRIDMLSSNLYFDDGQIQDEVFVMGSFLQSKMAKAGVTCSNCHNPHSGKPRFEGNQLCSQCHNASTYDVPEHHQHKVDTQGAMCVNCHMPERTYMQVDERRDHSFVIPNADVSAAINSPNACINCHQEQGLSWVSDKLKQWPRTASAKNGLGHWSTIHLLAPEKQVAFAQQQFTQVTPLVAAKLLDVINLQPTQASVNLAVEHLQAQEPLLRRGAINVLRRLPVEQVTPLLEPLFKDPDSSVRFDVASTFSGWLSQLPHKDLPRILAGLEEYQQSLLLTADFPNSQISLAHIAMAKGKPTDAQRHFEQALKIAPHLPVAMLAYADFWRQMANSEKEQAVLARAVKINPDFADVLHQYGLYFVRQKQYNQAAKWLVAAAKLNDAQAYYAYVAASALDTIGRTKEAVNLLLEANQRWPNQLDLLFSLGLYADKTKDANSIQEALKTLTVLLPNHPQVKQWQSRFP
ncbi:tetratricopeptide repeat protein [Paraglaciecola sp.]|uniref:tetratricopeptide repeat protein n=1 Tax=Paraglaciecola sp. TaxID=1920173 RepID=UPI00273E1C4D|nr:multiheme c-type cytochrome [Paraglaciecola sp.]MDP5033303.1 hypothetical protein [Paraglaciecola sp.]